MYMEHYRDGIKLHNRTEWKQIASFHKTKHKLYYIKNQQDANLAVLFISNCKFTLRVSDASRVQHQEY